MGQTSTHTNNEYRPSVALFVTCLVNSIKPGIGFAAARLLEAAGYQVDVPTNQSCCGQPNYNNGDPHSAAAVARQVIETFSPWDRVIVPSASCAGMLKNHYPRLLKNDPPWHKKALALADRVSELTEFLRDNRDKLSSNAEFSGMITHHDSCSSIREIHNTQAVRDLVSHCLPNADFRELTEPEACCGFGGTFCVKFNDVSRKMGQNKLDDITATKASTATSLDLGCLLQIQSTSDESLSNPRVKFMHLAELLAKEIC